MRPVPCLCDGAATAVQVAPSPLCVFSLSPRSPPPLVNSLSVAIIFISYALQAKFQPYAVAGLTNDLDAMAMAPGVRLVYVRALPLGG